LFEEELFAFVENFSSVILARGIGCLRVKNEKVKLDVYVFYLSFPIAQLGLRAREGCPHPLINPLGIPNSSMI
jgi:hypothetical protein